MIFNFIQNSKLLMLIDLTFHTLQAHNTQKIRLVLCDFLRGNLFLSL